MAEKKIVKNDVIGVIALVNLYDGMNEIKAGDEFEMKSEDAVKCEELNLIKIKK